MLNVEPDRRGGVESAASQGAGGGGFTEPPPPVEVRQIRAVMKRGKHCLMIVSPRAVTHLKQHTDIDPIVVYLSPCSKGVVKVATLICL